MKDVKNSSRTLPLARKCKPSTAHWRTAVLIVAGIVGYHAVNTVIVDAATAKHAQIVDGGRSIALVGARSLDQEDRGPVTLRQPSRAEDPAH